MTVHGDEIGGLAGFTDLEEYLLVLWMSMTKYGYLVNPTTENGV